jgi:alkanesulfonate monooxygenase SsuD/methylene tetrahydromethanopterin reductase-like flavin-dependent oxidoreductase (luciferase family)
MRRLWSGEPVSYSGRHFSLDGDQIGLRPLQPGGPPIWIGTNGREGGVRAARIGDGIVYLHTNPMRRIARLDALFREEAAGAPRTRAVLREVCVRPDARAARAVAEPHMRYEAEDYARFGYAEQLLTEFDRLCEEAYLLTDPEGCIAAHR